MFRVVKLFFNTHELKEMFFFSSHFYKIVITGYDENLKETIRLISYQWIVDALMLIQN